MKVPSQGALSWSYILTVDSPTEDVDIYVKQYTSQADKLVSSTSYEYRGSNWGPDSIQIVSS